MNAPKKRLLKLAQGAQVAGAESTSPGQNAGIFSHLK